MEVWHKGIPSGQVHEELEKLRCFTRNEFQNNTEAILKMVDDGQGPVLIRSEGHPDLVLIAWDEYWERFGMIHESGEREAIEEACRYYKEDK